MNFQHEKQNKDHRSLLILHSKSLFPVLLLLVENQVWEFLYILPLASYLLRHVITFLCQCQFSWPTFHSYTHIRRSKATLCFWKCVLPLLTFFLSAIFLFLPISGHTSVLNYTNLEGITFTTRRHDRERMQIPWLAGRLFDRDRVCFIMPWFTCFCSREDFKR